VPLDPSTTARRTAGAAKGQRFRRKEIRERERESEREDKREIERKNPQEEDQGPGSSLV
jgi:hypothetical protein